MLTLKLVRLIEKHSEELVKGLTEKIQLSERTSDFRKIPAAELELAVAEVYRNLGEWLLQKTDKDIETRFRAIGARRATEGVGPHHFVWALIYRKIKNRFQYLNVLEDGCVNDDRCTKERGVLYAGSYTYTRTEDLTRGQGQDLDV